MYYPKGEARKPFDIDHDTGDLYASMYHEFDRESRPFEDVTVKVSVYYYTLNIVLFPQATDKGDRPLIGFCQITVTVDDVNDNKPQFEHLAYETSVHR